MLRIIREKSLFFYCYTPISHSVTPASCSGLQWRSGELLHKAPIKEECLVGMGVRKEPNTYSAIG